MHYNSCLVLPWWLHCQISRTLYAQTHINKHVCYNALTRNLRMASHQGQSRNRKYRRHGHRNATGSSYHTQPSSISPSQSESILVLPTYCHTSSHNSAVDTGEKEIIVSGTNLSFLLSVSQQAEYVESRKRMSITAQYCVNKFSTVGAEPRLSSMF